MMLQTMYKYFNKKIKMIMLLLLILMWSLMGQHVYGKSSTYDIGSIKTAEATPADAAVAVIVPADDIKSDASIYETNSIRDMNQENIAKITRTNEAKEPVKAAVNTQNKDKNNNTSTIYEHINENDNNSNKLPQNVVAKRVEQEQHTKQKPTNMMYRNMKMPALLALSATSSSSASVSSPSSIATMSEVQAIAAIPPTAALLMSKDQLNETKYKIPRSKNLNVNNENKPEESIELKTSMLKVNDSSDNGEAAGETNKDLNFQDINNKTSESNGNETNAAKINDGEKVKNDEEAIEPTFNSLAHFRQEFIAQLAQKIKYISRLTYFTCKNPEEATVENEDSLKSPSGNYKRHLGFNPDIVDFVKLMYSRNPSLMLKVVTIDHLLNKNRLSSSSSGKRVGFGRTGGFGAAAANGPAARNTFTNVNWLEQILKPEPFRQLVVLDLACGAASRRLLEMASNKAFFNTMYHWLLLEDYVFNRQTEIDDVDDIDRTATEKATKTTTIKSPSTRTSNSYSKSSKKEIVNDINISIATNRQAKKLSTYPSDVVGASTSGFGVVKNKVTPNTFASPPTSSSSSSSLFLSKICNRQQKQQQQEQQQQRIIDEKSTTGFSSPSSPPSASASTPSSFTASNATRSGVTDEDDIEIIEKFLEKLNININTELILAKRRMRAIITTNSFSSLSSSSSSSSSSTTPQPLSILRTSSASTDSDDYNTLQKMDYYLLYDVWNPGQQYGGVLNITEIGNFSLNKGIQLTQDYQGTSTIMRRINMNLAKVRCLVVTTHKNNSDGLEDYLTTHFDTHLDSMNRFNFALLMHVRELFNMSFILSKTSTWGYLKNGKFDGMIGALVRKQADIGGSPIFFRIERAKVIDYTTRTWVARPCFIFRHPRSTKKDRIVFLQPFSNDVWIFVAICGFTTIFLLWLLTTLERKYEPEEFETNNTPDDLKVTLTSRNTAINNKLPSYKGRGLKIWFVRWGGLFCGQDVKDIKSRRRMGLFFESLLFYIGSICQQGLSFSTFLFSGRCIVITSLLFSFSIFQFYSASIVGTLLMEKPKTIRTLRDLIHSTLEIGIEDIVYNRDYFLRTKDPDAQELYAKKVTSVPMTGDNGFVDAPPDNVALPTQATVMTDAQKAKAYRDILHSHETGAHAKTNEASNWYDPDYGVAKIKKGRFAFHVDVATAYKIIADTFTEKEICDLTEIQLFPPQKMVSIVQKGSPLRKVITYGLRRVTEVGLTDYQRKVWHSPKPRCVKQLHTDDLRVDMQTFTSALLVLIFGFVVSLMILSLEIVHFKLWQRYTTTTTTTTT